MARPERPSSGASPPRSEIYWRTTEAVHRRPALEGDLSCDVCIVGGGYTGLWTAVGLLDADASLRVVVLERDYAGAGASGHNDGFVTPTIGHSLHTVIDTFGPEAAKDAYTAMGQSILGLRRFCRKESVDAELEPRGFYLVATSPGQRRRLEHDVSLAARMGVTYEVLERAEAQERIGSALIEGGLKTPGALINPHKLARGLARVAEGRGATIHEGTTCVDVRPTGSGFRVGTTSGAVSAAKVVVATDAYQHLWPTFERTTLPVWSYAVVTERLSDEQLGRIHWPDREGFVEARNFIDFGRLTADNRILFGGGPAPYHYGSDMRTGAHLSSRRLTGYLSRRLREYFPELADVGIAYSYGGCIGMTRGLIPHVGRDRQGVHYSYGYCGNGITMTHLCGQVMRDLLLERDTALTNLPFVGRAVKRFPPEPMAFAGARAVSGALAAQDRWPGVLSRPLV